MKKEAKEMAATKEKSCLKKNLLWVILGCVIGIVLIVVIVLLSTRKAGNRQQYKECWSNEPVWNDIESLVIPDRVCNEESVTALDLSKYPKLKSLWIGRTGFEYVNELSIIGLSELERVVIGDNCFTQHMEEYGGNPNRHFYLKNCPKLKSLKIGRYSFSDYTVIEIGNVDALEVIEMGDLNNLNEDSYNFYSASLELKSILIHNE